MVTHRLRERGDRRVDVSARSEHEPAPVRRHRLRARARVLGLPLDRALRVVETAERDERLDRVELERERARLADPDGVEVVRQRADRDERVLVAAERDLEQPERDAVVQRVPEIRHRRRDRGALRQLLARRLDVAAIRRHERADAERAADHLRVPGMLGELERLLRVRVGEVEPPGAQLDPRQVEADVRTRVVGVRRDRVQPQLLEQRARDIQLVLPEAAAAEVVARARDRIRAGVVERRLQTERLAEPGFGIAETEQRLEVRRAAGGEDGQQLVAGRRRQPPRLRRVLVRDPHLAADEMHLAERRVDARTQDGVVAHVLERLRAEPDRIAGPCAVESSSSQIDVARSCPVERSMPSRISSPPRTPSPTTA